MEELYDEIEDLNEEETAPYEYSITSYGADYTVEGLVDKLNKAKMVIPKFQRSYVWNVTQASRFIESLLFGLPVPGIFLSKESETQKLLVIDGQQRLKSLQFFYEGLFKGREFKLKNVHSMYDGKSYKELTESEKLKLDDSIIHATIIKQDEPSHDSTSIYHVFERLNTGGTMLQPQEIRASIYHGPLNDLLSELGDSTDWNFLYGKPHLKLKDQELILRFIALYYDLDNYKKPLKEFLNKYMAKNRYLKHQSKEEISDLFLNTIHVIATNIGKRAFRFEKVIVAAAFDSIMVGVAARLENGEIEDGYLLVERYDRLMENEEFISSCKGGTSDEQTVLKRITLAKEAFKDVN